MALSRVPARPGLRQRLLGAFLVVSLPPLLLLAVTLNVLVTRRFDDATERRLQTALAAVERRLAAVEARASAQVASIAREELPALPVPEEGERALAAALAPNHALEALEIVDERGRVLSSYHWPAGFGLPERDVVFSGPLPLRVETVASGYGSTERLALMPARPASWRDASVTVRGGAFVDADFLADLSGLMGVAVGLRHVRGARWFAPADSPLAAWSAPGPRGDATRGDVRLGGAPYSWAARPLSPEIWIVVATPRADQEALSRGATLATAALAAAAALGGLGLAFVLASRIAGPVREVARGAQRVASGDLSQPVPVLTADEVGDLARAFNAMTDELRASRDRAVQAERVAAWREMARRLAHELKNPIFPIQVSIETLRRAHAQQKDAAAFGAFLQESIDTILAELASLKKIIDEFSDFSRMPRPTLNPTDVNDVADHVVGLYRAWAEGTRLEAELETPLPRVPADPDLLRRAVANLVANAIEAMPQGGLVTVRTRSTPAAVLLEVSDTGPGLTEDQRTRLFTPYFTTKKGGTGLGLAIVQGIVSDHGGRIEVASEPGRGTTFTLMLPRN